jgi:hypothetical protein
MGVDFNRIGFGISSGTSRTGFGTIVSFPSGGGGCPAAGTLISTQDDIEYAINIGGYYTTYQHEETLNPSNFIPNQTRDVYVRADGDCGTYLDETEVIDGSTWYHDVKYKAYGVFAASEVYTNYITISGNCSSSSQFTNGTRLVGYYHDGIGTLYSNPISYDYEDYGVFFFSEECNDNDGNPYTTSYFSDGDGSYYTS